MIWKCKLKYVFNLNEELINNVINMVISNVIFCGDKYIKG